MVIYVAIQQALVPNFLVASAVARQLIEHRLFLGSQRVNILCFGVSELFRSQSFGQRPARARRMVRWNVGIYRLRRGFRLAVGCWLSSLRWRRILRAQGPETKSHETHAKNGGDHQYSAKCIHRRELLIGYRVSDYSRFSVNATLPLPLIVPSACTPCSPGDRRPVLHRLNPTETTCSPSHHRVGSPRGSRQFQTDEPQSSSC